MSKSAPEVKKLDITKISAPPETQMRAKMDDEAVSRYAELYEQGTDMEPLDVFGPDENGIHYCGDGHHRLLSAGLSNTKSVKCRVHKGGLREAILFAAGPANTRHGIPLKDADRRRRVIALLEDAEWKDKGGEQIARHCHLNKKFVLDVKRQWKEDKGEKATPQTPRVGAERGGRKRKDGKPNAAATGDAPRSLPATTTQREGLDDYGQKIPKDILEVAFDQDTGRIISNSLKEIVKDVEKLCESEGGKLLSKNNIVAGLKSAAEGIERGTFAAVCPACEGNRKDGETDCQHCAGRGWISGNDVAALPNRFRKKLNEAKTAAGKG